MAALKHERWGVVEMNAERLAKPCRQGLTGCALEVGPDQKDSTSPWGLFRRMVRHDQTC